MILFTRMALGVAFAATLVGCATPGSPVPPASGADPQARWEAGQAAYLAWNARRPGWRTTASGLQYKVLKRAPATSPRPEPGGLVTIHYTGVVRDRLGVATGRVRLVRIDGRWLVTDRAEE